MHALVAAVLLRMAGLDALDLDAEPQPPDRELGQIEEGVRTRERHAIIGADGLGQAVLLEDGLEHLESVGFPGSGERLAGEEVTAGEVGDRERIAIATIGEHEFAFVVGAPQIIGLTGKGKGCSVCPVSPPASALDQAMTVEHRMHRADRRRVDIRVEAPQLVPDLGRAPTRLVLLEAHDLRLDLEGELVGVAVGPARAIGEAVQADLVIAGEDLVAGLARDAELAA
jgi:hypothetical protein